MKLRQLTSVSCVQCDAVFGSFLTCYMLPEIVQGPVSTTHDPSCSGQHTILTRHHKTFALNTPAYGNVSGELIVSRYVAESITTDAGHVGLCQLHTKLYAVDKGLHG